MDALSQEDELREQILRRLEEVKATSSDDLRKYICGRSRRKQLAFNRVVENLVTDGRVRRLRDEVTQKEMITLPPMPIPKFISAIYLQIGIAEGPLIDAYVFSMDAHELSQLVQIIPARRISGELVGIQRRYLKTFVEKKLVEYITTDRNPIIPDSVLVAIRPIVDVTPDEERENLVTLHFLWSPSYVAHEKPFILIDGQQRLEAVRRSGKHVIVPVIALGEHDMKFCQKMFLVANTKRTMSPSLIKELWVSLRELLPEALRRKECAARIVSRLDEGYESPFYEITSSEARRDGNRVVHFSSLVDSVLLCLEGEYIGRVKEKRDRIDHKLFLEYCVVRDRIDVDQASKCLEACFGAVKEVFADAWGLSSKESKLMHSTGLRSMLQFLAYVIDRRDQVYGSMEALKKYVKQELSKIKDECYWTRRDWETLEGRIRDGIRKLRDLITRARETGWSGPDIKNLEAAIHSRERELQYIPWRDVGFTWRGIQWLTNELVRIYEECGS